MFYLSFLSNTPIIKYDAKNRVEWLYIIITILDYLSLPLSLNNVIDVKSQ